MCSCCKTITIISLIKPITTTKLQFFSPLGLRTFMIYSLSNFQIHSTVYQLQSSCCPSHPNGPFILCLEAYIPFEHLLHTLLTNDTWLHPYTCMPASLCSSKRKPIPKSRLAPCPTAPCGDKAVLHEWHEGRKSIWSQPLLASLLIRQNVANCRGNNKANIYCMLPFFFSSEKPINCISGWMETSRPSNCTLCSLRSSPLLQAYVDKYVSA